LLENLPKFRENPIAFGMPPKSRRRGPGIALTVFRRVSRHVAAETDWQRDSIMTGKRIVLIEDNEDLANIVQYRLKREGFQVTCRGDGVSGLEEVRTQKPDLVILDIFLPRMNGFEVLQNLKQDEQTKPIPVVMLTALSQEENVVKGFELGAADYLIKPLRPHELVIRINKLLGGQG
jgi:CheY-like chemotaxis protein